MQAEEPRIRDVAQRAGVSAGTVSNVLNRPDLVATATRERVEKAIADLGFVRNAAARRLRARHNSLIGLVVIDLVNPFFSELARGVDQTAEAFGYEVLLCNADSSARREARHLQTLEEHRVAGVLISPIALPDATPRLEVLSSRGTHVVLVDAPGDADRCSVTVDDVLGGELAGRHLLELGRRNITYVTVIGQFRQFDDRLAGLRLAIAKHPDRDDVVLDVVQIPTLDGSDVVGRTDAVLRTSPDGIFCANDVAALAVLQGLLARGLAVPGDVALVGYDAIAFAAMAAVPLTSVRQPAYELGATAARLLFEECSAEPHDHRRVVFEPVLVERQSTLGR